MFQLRGLSSFGVGHSHDSRGFRKLLRGRSPGELQAQMNLRHCLTCARRRDQGLEAARDRCRHRRRGKVQANRTQRL
jgi:hypothetical protein